MDADDIENLDYDAMEPIDNDNDNDIHSSPYLNHLVIPIKQIVRPSPPPMTFQTPVKVKKVNYDDILASMNLYVKDGQLHKINRSDGINLVAPKSRPTQPTSPPQPTQEELQKQRNERRKALYLNYLQQQRLRVQIAATKSKQIKFINDSRNIELDSHTTMQFFKMFGK
jgi:hypothetical protein